MINLFEDVYLILYEGQKPECGYFIYGNGASRPILTLNLLDEEDPNLLKARRIAVEQGYMVDNFPNWRGKKQILTPFGKAILKLTS